MDLPFVHGPLPAAFRRRTVVVDPGGSRAYDSAEWADELVVVEHGRLDLECHNGGVRTFPAGAVVCLEHLALRALHNSGADPTVLVAVSRRPDHARPDHRSGAMHPRIVDLPERPYVGIRRTCTLTTMDRVADRVPEIIGHLLSRGGGIAGAPFLRYHLIDMADELEVEACVPTDDVGHADGEIVAGALPAGRYAVLLHQGHPDGLAEETSRLLGWAAAEGHTFDMTVTEQGERWVARTEHFLTDPREQPDPDHWESELAFRLADPDPAVVTTGSPEDPTVLLIGTTAATWDDAFCARLAGRHVVRYDLRDTGRAAVVDPDGPAYTLRDLVSDAAALLSGPAHVVGLGVGGWIAQLVALDHPELVSTLTLIAGRPNAPGPPDPDLPEHDAALMAALVGGAEPDWDDRAAVLDHMAEHARVFAGAGRHDADDARARAGRVFDRAAGRGAAVQRASQAGTVFAALDCRPPWRTRLPAITAPTLVIHGADDPFFPVGNAEALAREIPGATLRVLPGTGHGLPGHTHAEVAEALLHHTAQE